jgi:hypothetical protein
MDDFDGGLTAAAPPPTWQQKKRTASSNSLRTIPTPQRVTAHTHSFPKVYLAAVRRTDNYYIAGSLIVHSAQSVACDLSKDEECQLMRMPTNLKRTVAY